MNARDPREELALVGVLVPSLVHELNNPLGVLLIGVDTLSEDLGDPARARETLEGLNDQVQRLKRVLENTYALSSRAQGTRTELVLDAALEEALEAGAGAGRLRLEVEERGLRCSVVPDQIPVFLDLLASLLSPTDAAPVTLSLRRNDIPLPLPGRVRTRPFVSLTVGTEEGDLEPGRTLVSTFFDGNRGDRELRFMALREMARRWGGRVEMVGPVDDPQGLQVHLQRIDGGAP